MKVKQVNGSLYHQFSFILEAEDDAEKALIHFMHDATAKMIACVEPSNELFVSGKLVARPPKAGA